MTNQGIVRNLVVGEYVVKDFSRPLITGTLKATGERVAYTGGKINSWACKGCWWPIRKNADGIAVWNHEVCRSFMLKMAKKCVQFPCTLDEFTIEICNRPSESVFVSPEEKQNLKKRQVLVSHPEYALLLEK